MKKIINKTMQTTIPTLLTSFFILSNAIAAPTAISGSQCQANDEGAISSGKLIRSTFGITNKSNETITVYCPVDTSIKGDKLKVNIKYTVQEFNYEIIGVDTVVATNLDCVLAFNRKYNSSGQARQHIEGERKYNTFKRTKFAPDAVTSTILNNTSNLSNDPLVIKCKIRSGDQIKSINSEKP